jgi:hypothetical protein
VRRAFALSDKDISLIWEIALGWVSTLALALPAKASVRAGASVRRNEQERGYSTTSPSPRNDIR